MEKKKRNGMKKMITVCALLFLICFGAISVHAEMEGLRVKQEFYFENTYTYSMTYPGLQNSYPVNLSFLGEDDREYFWGFDFTDGNKLYTIGTFRYHNEGATEMMSLKKMQSELWLHRGESSSGWAGDAEFKKKGEKIYWTFDVPDDFDTSSFRITRIYAQIQGNYTFNESTPSSENRWENPFTVKGKKCTVKAASLKKKKALITENDAFKIPDCEGKITYKKVSGSAELSINKKTGFITVKKGTKAGKYSIRVKLTASGNDWYLPATKYANVQVLVQGS